MLVLHNVPGDDAAVDSLDVFAQRDAVLSALTECGIEARSAGCNLDLNAVRREIEVHGADVVFNLVESLAGTDRLMSLVPLLLDALDVPYTGASSAAVLATGSKVAAKQQMRSKGLPTPDWCTRTTGAQGMVTAGTEWIVKPVWEHASLGMDDDSVFVAHGKADLHGKLAQFERRTNCSMLAERYIAGREFNLSLLAGEVLPPAEIDFAAFPAGKPRIVGHAAKWKESSFEYQQTPRRFRFSASDAGLLDELCALASQCWELFGLTGFARVDFRVDTGGRPWILEVNVNPCLSPDAGFAAALSVAGIEFAAAIRRIVNEAVNVRTEPVLDR